jgi:hypothetical protein
LRLARREPTEKAASVVLLAMAVVPITGAGMTLPPK